MFDFVYFMKKMLLLGELWPLILYFESNIFPGQLQMF